MKNKIILLALILGALVIVFVARRNSGITEQELQDLNTKSVSTSTPVLVTGRGDFSVEPIPPSTILTPKIPVWPNYRRKLTFPAYYNENAKTLTQREVTKNQIAIDADKTNIGAWVELGNYYNLTKDYEGARLFWEYAIALNPSNFVALFNLGTLHMSDLRDYKLSESYLQKAMVVDPSQISAYYSLYELYRYALLDDTKAKAVLDDGIKKNPGKAQDLEYLRVNYDSAT